ncbi:MAG: class I SAM-dependent methyltransferase [Tannerellaceae bacterium]|jgi:hypothetical protein|nr:class I SAM-dependent methyltransferase [Tannerellaceae bacterium]
MEDQAVCKICGSHSNYVFSTNILGKYCIAYYKCSVCDFLQTENAYWLKEAYSNAIAHSDIGYVSRNLMYRTIVSFIIKSKFDRKAQFLDYGGGYGLFVRLMRDVGFDFYRQDLYCENLFAQHFDLIDKTGLSNDFALLTAFEVFEHFDAPMREVEQMLQHSRSILFSTDLLPDNLNNPAEWWYLSPETGQHIAFYSEKSLRFIADKLGLNLYTDKKNLHLLTDKKMNAHFIQYVSLYFRIIFRLSAKYFDNKKSLIKADVEYIKQCNCAELK